MVKNVVKQGERVIPLTCNDQTVIIAQDFREEARHDELRVD